MFYKVQEQLIDKPDLLGIIQCPIKIPEPLPEAKVIDYYNKFESLENEEIFVKLAG